MMLRGWVLAGLVVVVGFGAPGDIYQWTYDQLALGPGWRGHLFANRTGEEVVGLELLPGGGPATVLVVGGSLVQGAGSSAGLVFLGRVVPGGVVVVALPEGTALHGAVWVTAAGQVPIEIDPPIPRLVAEEIWPLITVSDYVGEDYDPNKGDGYAGGGDDGPEQVWLWDPLWDSKIQIPRPDRERPKDSFLWFRPPDLDPALLQGWEGYPYLVRLDGRRSFSPVGKEIVAWRWTWEDGLVQEGQVVVRGFDSPGTYWVQLTVTDSVGRVQTLTRFVTTADWEEVLAAWLQTLASAEREVNTKPMEVGWLQTGKKEKDLPAELKARDTRTVP